MKILVGFKNPKTGETRNVKCGFSWTLLFWSGLYGIPLFFRKLNVWGIVMLVLCLASMVIGVGNIEALPIIVLTIVLDIWLGFKGNEMTARSYLENDWQLVDPNNDVTKLALKNWGIIISLMPEAGVSSETAASVSPPQKKKLSFLNIIILSVLGILGVFIILGRNADDHTIASSSGTSSTASPPPKSSPANSTWSISQEVDKLTDKTNLEAHKVFPVENGNIVAIARCLQPQDTKGIAGIELEFDYFNNEKKLSYYEAQADGVPVQIRLDNNDVESYSFHVLDYRNQIKFEFLNERYQTLMAASKFRARLPLVEGSKADIEIPMSELKDFIISKCRISCHQEALPVVPPRSHAVCVSGANL